MKNIIAIILISFSLFSCMNNEVPDVDFGVTTLKTTYKVGDTITFNFAGNPDFISFYPGIAGSDYQFKERTILEGKTQIQFTSYKQNGQQLNSLKLLVSTDFIGTFNKAGLASATWTDITDRAILSTGTDNTASGVIDISEFVKPDKNIFVAFRKTDTQSATLKPNQWTIKNFNLDVKLANESLYPVASIGNAGWLAVDSLNSAIKWSISSTALTCAGGALNSVANEDWIITKALTPLNITPDLAIPIKWVDTKRTESFNYIYKTAGTYELVFVASNQSVYDVKKMEKRITLTITN